jgi:hypothetical protein
MVGSIPVDRRLNRRSAGLLIFTASIFLSAVISLAVLSKYLVPDTPYVTLGNMARFPPSDSPYSVYASDGYSVFIVNTGTELIVLDAHTPHFTNWRMKWVPANHRFEDPVTGSKFSMTGEYLEGPATRNLDRFGYRILADGTLQLDPWEVTQGDPRDYRSLLSIWE